MKQLFLALACCLFAACGGGSGGSAPVPIAQNTTGAGMVGTAFNVVIPHETAITPQYLSSTSQQFFFDLQDINGVNYTLTVDAAHCTFTPTQDQSCSWPVSVPPGQHTVSIAVATGNQGSLNSLPPALLGYAHALPFDSADGRVNVVFDAITGGSRGNGTMGFHYSDPFTAGPSDAGTVPWISAGVYDSGNAIIAWNPFVDGPDAPSQVPVYLLNPLTFTFTDETTGKMKLGELTRASSGIVSTAAGVTSVTLNTLDGVLGFRLLDGLTGSQTSHFQVGFSNPGVTVTDAEFPQIHSFTVPGGGTQTTWSAKAFGVGLFVQCVAPVMGTQPCTQANS
jgi:hypothetical protein